MKIAVNKAGVEVEVDVRDNAEKSRDESDKGTAAQANDVTAPVEIAVNKAGVEVEVDVCDNAEKSRDKSDKGTAAQAVHNDATTDTTNDTTEEGVTKVGQH